MKTVYEYNVITLIFEGKNDLGYFDNIDENDLPKGKTFKAPDWHKRLTSIIKWNNTKNDWEYTPRDSHLYTHITDTDSHRTRANNYSSLISFYNFVKRDLDENYVINNAPEDLVEFCSSVINNEFSDELNTTINSLQPTPSEALKWVKDYEIKKDTKVF